MPSAPSIASNAASVPSAVTIRTRASTDRFGASCSSGGAAGEAGGAPGAGVSGRIGVALATRGRTLRSRAIGNALPASSDRPQPPDATSKTSDAGKTEANRRVLVLATSVRAKQPSCHRRDRRARPAACPQRGIPRGDAARYRNIVTKRVLPRGPQGATVRCRCCRSRGAPPDFSGPGERGGSRGQRRGAWRSVQALCVLRRDHRDPASGT